MIKKVIWIIVAIVVAWGTNFTPVALAQDPRPPVDTGGGSGGGGAKDKSDDKKPQRVTCGAVIGQLINWGYRAEPGIAAVLSTGSWQVSDISSTEGNYSFGGLGVGVARLNVSLAPGASLQPAIRDAAVHLTCDYPTYANIALFSGSGIEPPVALQMSASTDIVSWDDDTRITLTVQNNLPTDISNVIVTNVMPPGLTALAVSTSANVPAENARIVDGGDDGQLAVAYLDKMASGTEEKVVITVRAIEDTPHTQMRNTATLFYRESVAVQDSLDLTVRRGGVMASSAALSVRSTAPKAEDSTASRTVVAQAQSTPTPKPATSPTVAVSASPSPTTVPKAETSATAVAQAEKTVEDPSQPDSLLPRTGDKVAADTALTKTADTRSQANNTVGSLSGLGLVGLAFIAYALRSFHQRQPRN